MKAARLELFSGEKDEKSNGKARKKRLLSVELIAAEMEAQVEHRSQLRIVNLKRKNPLGQMFRSLFARLLAASRVLRKGKRSFDYIFGCLVYWKLSARK